MKRFIIFIAVMSFLSLPRALAQFNEDPAAKEAGQEEEAVDDSIQMTLVITATTDFDGETTLAIMTTNEVIDARKTIRRENEAAQKAFTRVKKVWTDKYAPAKKADAAKQYTQDDINKMTNGSSPTTTTGTIEKKKTPPFPLKRAPSKDFKQLEICKSEEKANTRLEFHKQKQSEKEDTPTASKGASLRTGTDSSFSPSKFKKSEAKPVDDAKALDEVMVQFRAEVDKILAGTDDGDAKGSKSGLGAGTSKGFGGSSSLKK